jgi:hypothetical protein
MFHNSEVHNNPHHDLAAAWIESIENAVGNTHKSGKPGRKAFSLVSPAVKIIAILIFLALLGIGIPVKMYLDSQNKLQLYQTGLAPIPTPNANELKNFIKKVSNHLILPDEEPKVLPLTNIDLLKKEQPFFSQAKNGDVLLIYSQKVILYDPATDRVVDIAQIRITPAIQTSGSITANNPVSTLSAGIVNTPSPTIKTDKYKLALLLGSGSEDAFSAAEKTIQKEKNIEIINRGKAVKKNYEKNLIIDLNNTDSKIIEKLAGSLSAVISPLPNGEIAPEGADILIIIGKQT